MRSSEYSYGLRLLRTHHPGRSLDLFAHASDQRYGKIFHVHTGLCEELILNGSIGMNLCGQPHQTEEAKSSPSGNAIPMLCSWPGSKAASQFTTNSGKTPLTGPNYTGAEATFLDGLESTMGLRERRTRQQNTKATNAAVTSINKHSSETLIHMG